MANRDDGGPIPANQKGHYPRPMGGPEPSPQGDTRAFGNPSLPVNPGYDYSGSMPGVSKSELEKGICRRESITGDTKSDGMEGA